MIGFLGSGLCERFSLFFASRVMNRNRLHGLYYYEYSREGRKGAAGRRGQEKVLEEHGCFSF